MKKFEGFILFNLFSLKKETLVKTYKTSINAGISLIEVVISMVILSVVAMYLATAVPIGFLVTQKTEDITRASEIAQRYLEQTRIELAIPGKYNLVDEGSDPPIPITDTITNYGYFTVNTQVDFVGPSGNESSLKEINVTFTKTGSAELLINLSTVIEKPKNTI